MKRISAMIFVVLALPVQAENIEDYIGVFATEKGTQSDYIYITKSTKKGIKTNPYFATIAGPTRKKNRFYTGDSNFPEYAPHYINGHIEFTIQGVSLGNTPPNPKDATVGWTNGDFGSVYFKATYAIKLDNGDLILDCNNTSLNETSPCREKGSVSFKRVAQNYQPPKPKF